AMASRQKVGRQLAIVIDFSVEHRPDGAILVGEGLMSGLEIDDAQPTHPDAHSGLHVRTLVIRPSMNQRLAHGAKQSKAFWPISRFPADAEDAAHVSG